jgi:hypothetical protein
MEQMEAIIRGLGEDDDRRVTLEEAYGIGTQNFILAGGIENVIRRIFERVLPLSLAQLVEKKKEMQRYKNPPRPARFSIGRESVDGPRANARRSRRSSMLVAPQNPLPAPPIAHPPQHLTPPFTLAPQPGPLNASAVQAQIINEENHPDWDDIMEEELRKLAVNLHPKKTPVNSIRKFQFERDTAKRSTNRIIYYRIHCIVGCCNYIGSGRVGFLPGKSKNRPTARVDNVDSHFSTRHPFYAKNFVS